MDDINLEPHFICPSTALKEGGTGVRFDVIGPYGKGTGFAVRFDGVVRGYLNLCRHVPSELDWVPGQFFDDSALYLVCATHGARYDPHDGLCVSGPCHGKSLYGLTLIERDDAVFWLPTTKIYPPPAA